VENVGDFPVQFSYSCTYNELFTVIACDFLHEMFSSVDTQISLCQMSHNNNNNKYDNVYVVVIMT